MGCPPAGVDAARNGRVLNALVDAGRIDRPAFAQAPDKQKTRWASQTPGLERLPRSMAVGPVTRGRKPCHQQGNSKPAGVPIRSVDVSPTQQKARRCVCGKRRAFCLPQRQIRRSVCFGRCSAM